MATTPARLIVVSPDATLAQLVQESAAALGHNVISAKDLLEARRFLSRVDVDLICLDSILPVEEIDDLCRALSAESGRPAFVFIAPPSAKVVPSALPVSFQPRRDGLVTKPLRGRDLEREIARVLSTFARPREADLLRAGSVALDAVERKLLFASGGVLALTPTEYRLVRYLMEHVGEFVSPAELLENAWGYPKDTGGAEVVRAHVSNVRRKLRAIGEDAQMLRNQPYQGYGIVVEVGAAVARTAGKARAGR